MGDYNRKKSKRLNARKIKKSSRNSADYDEIKMRRKNFESSQSKGSPNAKLRVINGRKRQKLLNKISLVFLAAVLIGIIMLLSAISPTGLKEYITNSAAKMSNGSFPVEISGGKLIDFKNNGDILTVLTDTNFEIYNKSGKLICSNQHGMSMPAIKTSQARTILYGISDTSYKIFNYKEVLYSGKTDYEILSVDIARCGVYAVATRSDSFASEVVVYSKNNEPIFTWSSAKELVSNVAVSSNGKKFAVSTFYAENGVLNNNVYIFNFKSASPLYSFKYDQPILSINTSCASGFNVVSENRVDYITWNGNQTQNQTELLVDILKPAYDDYTAVCTRREGDKSQSDVLVFQKNGKQKAKVTVDGNIQDLMVFNKHIYCLVQTEIFVYDFNGQLIKTTNCGFGTSGIFVVNNDQVVLITESNLKLCTIK